VAEIVIICKCIGNGVGMGTKIVPVQLFGKLAASAALANKGDALASLHCDI